MRQKVSIFGFLCITLALQAQTQMQDPRHFKLEYEDERVRVMRLTLPPGESTPEMQMGERLLTWTSAGRVKTVFRTGEPERVEVVEGSAGQVQHLDAGPVTIENLGQSMWQCVITEFKPPFAHLQPPRQAPVQQVSPVTRDAQNKPKPQGVPMEIPPPQPAIQGTQTSPQLQPPVSAQPPRQMDQPPTATEPTALNVDGAKIAFLNGTELAYIERGQGQPVVLVHDTLGDYRSWAPQLTALARNYHVIAFSRRYHYPNHSTGKEHDYSYDINAKDLADFIRGLNVGPVRLVGFGYGASIAAMAAAEHPELVKALVITEPAFEKLLDATGAFRSSFAREEIYGIIRKPLTKDKPEKAVQVYVDWQGYQSWAGLSTEEQFRRKQNSNALHALTLDASPPNFTCATAKKITAPTLILSGQRRSPNSAEIAGVLSACIPNAERATVSNAGAAVYVDNPSEANKLLMEFLAKH